VGVAAEVGNDLGRAAEGLFGVDDPAAVGVEESELSLLEGFE